MSRIKVGDQVIVLQGKDRGKVGKVIERIPGKDKLVVEGINIAKRHVRARKRGQDSGIIEREAPLSVSKVMIVCPRCGKRTRIGVRVSGDSSEEREKLRICKKCGEGID